MAGPGAIPVSFHGFSMSVEPLESAAPLVSCDLPACMTLGTQLPCIG